MPTTEEMEKIRVGSRVVICSRFNTDLAVVDRDTATQFIVGQKRFRKADGYRVGNVSSWSGRDYIRLATHADIDGKLRAQFVAKLNAASLADLKEVDTATLEEACQMLGLSAGGRGA